VLRCVAVCCGVLRCVAVCCGVMRRVVMHWAQRPCHAVVAAVGAECCRVL